MTKTLLVVANNNIGPGQSGGDTIFLNLIKYWQKKISITVFASQESKNLLNRFQLRPKLIKSDSRNPHYSLSVGSLIYHNFRRILMGFIAFIKNVETFKTSDYCYTASDFWPDFLFGLLYKLVNPQGRWLCGYYLIVPKASSSIQPVFILFLEQKNRIRIYDRVEKLNHHTRNR